MVIHIPYEIIERIFGTWVADNFNTISIALFIAIGLGVLIFRGGNDNNFRPTT